MRIEAFLPSRHGFPCVLQSADGEDFGLGTPSPGAFGLSAGAAWTALDYYLAGRPLPAADAGAAPPEALLEAVVRRQGEALARAGWHQLRDWQSLPDRGVPGRPGITERSRTEFRRLRQLLDDGTPVMIYLVLAQGRHAEPSQNLAVLAYDYELDRRARRASVRVYDPARPGNDNVRLVFHTGAGKSLDARLAVKTAVRGFFCVPYDRPEPAALTLHSAANDGSRIERLLAVHGSAIDGSFEAIGAGPDGRLLHVRRRRSGGYATEHIDVDILDGSDVAQAAFVGGGRTVLWTTRGELIDCRRRPGLGWRARRITDTRTHGAFDGTATGVARERGRVSLFACGTGRLMHFRRGRLPTWEAEHVDAGPLARAACVGRPAGVRLGGAMHVVVRTRTGELMHARWRARGGWTAENVTARAGDRERFIVADDPVLLRDRRGRTLAAVVRSKNGSVLLFRWSERKGWRAFDLSSAAGAAVRESMRSVCPLSAAIEPDGTVHAAGRTEQGGLLHAWCTSEGTAGIQDLVDARPRIGSAARIDSAPVLIAGPADALHVMAQRDGELVLFRWAQNADWSVENVTREREQVRSGQQPLVFAEGSVAHVALLDDAGRAHHALLVPRGGTRRGLRVPAWLVDVLLFPLTLTGIIADAVSALIGLTRRGATPPPQRGAAPSDGASARVREMNEVPLPLVAVERDAPQPLPLLQESTAAEEWAHDPGHEAEAPAPVVPMVPSREDETFVSTNAASEVLDGPLDDLLGFGPAAMEAETVAEADSAAQHASRDAVPASGDGSADVGSVAPGDAESADPLGAEATLEPAAEEPSAGLQAAESTQAVSELTAEDTDTAKPAGDELIVVYPEPEQRNGKATRKQRNRRVDVTETAGADGDVDRSGAAEGRESVSAAEGVETVGGVEVDDRDSVDVISAADPLEPADAADTADTGTSDGVAAHESDPDVADPLPLLDDGSAGADEIIADAEPSEPWALPGFEVTSAADDWNAPDDEPWSVTPLEGLETSAAPDTDDWSLPPVDGLEATPGSSQDDDWSVPPLEEADQPGESDLTAMPALPAEPLSAAAPTPVEDEAPRPSIADTDDDWNLPDDAPAVVPKPVDTATTSGLDLSFGLAGVGDSGVDGTGQATSDGTVDRAESMQALEPDAQEGHGQPGEATGAVAPTEAAQREDVTGSAESRGPADSDPSVDALESVQPFEPADSMATAEGGTASPAEPPRRRKWQNPALEGLPLLDEDDDDAPVAAQPLPPLPPPPPKQPARPAARKKAKKASADEIERIIALAEANQPELLPPD
ncbi:MAG TPA: hypothetical protein VFU06_07250 [Longimicrobiales bacterium]|nr:hypothetical protein [Longimicrobiales bacterium]